MECRCGETWKGDRWGWKEVTDGRDRGKKEERACWAKQRGKDEEEEVAVQEDADIREDN